LTKSRSDFVIAALLGAACVLAAPGAAAQNWVTLLKNTPAESFDDEDLRLFLDAARKTLNEAPDNQPVTWENPKSRNRGEMTVLRSFESRGNACKEVRVRNESRGRKSDNRRILCKVDERWRLVSEAQLKANAKPKP
jgi:surface antigen